MENNSKKPISRQRKAQLRNIQDGLCAFGRIHGPIYKQGLCEPCYQRHANNTNKSYKLNSEKIKNRRKLYAKENVKLGLCSKSKSHGEIYKYNLCLNCYEKARVFRETNLNKKCKYKYKCSFCREPGHNIARCEKRVSFLKSKNTHLFINSNNDDNVDYVILNPEE